MTYAGFSGESVVLEDLYKRGLTLPQVGPDLYAGDGLLMFWSHEPIAPLANAELAGQHAAQSAAEPVPEHDRKQVRYQRRLVHYARPVGCNRRS